MAAMTLNPNILPPGALISRPSLSRGAHWGQVSVPMRPLLARDAVGRGVQRMHRTLVFQAHLLQERTPPRVAVERTQG